MEQSTIGMSRELANHFCVRSRHDLPEYFPTISCVGGTLYCIGPKRPDEPYHPLICCTNCCTESYAKVFKST
jgi:hypothetical protein